MLEAQIFKALGDPTRLSIVRQLSDGSIYTIGDLTKGLGITRQGGRKQVQVLVDAHIIKLRPEGREVFVSLDAKRLKAGKDFITQLEKGWEGSLEG